MHIYTHRYYRSLKQIHPPPPPPPPVALIFLCECRPLLSTYNGRLGPEARLTGDILHVCMSGKLKSAGGCLHRNVSKELEFDPDGL